MRKLEQLVCRHEYEPRSMHVDAGELVKQCRKCGKRARERQPATRRSV
ncbi:hypothetical protein [Halobellus rubicundus]|uniref:HNH endonuclease n=1 Tax=Halobellus rubicundus TaxID=2996466 RepID=A0ABD5MBL3_9EURY